MSACPDRFPDPPPLFYELIDTGCLNRRPKRDRLHFTQPATSISAKLHFYNGVAGRVYTAEMHSCSTVGMVWIKCTELEITSVVWT